MGHKPSDLGPLPSNWKSVKFGSITKVRQGLQIAISDRLTLPTSTSKEYITIQSINRQNQDREYVESPSNRVICKTDDVLMTRTGNTGIVVTGVEGAFHNNFFLIDFDRKTIDGTFFINYLRSPRVQYVILTKAGASTIPDLNHKDFYAIEFPLAPLHEQKKIAQILSTWDQAISTTEQLLANSQRQKKALMQQLLTGKKRLLDKNGVRFSGEWQTVKLQSLVEIIYGKSPKDILDPEGEIPVYGTGGISGYSKEALCLNPAVLIGRKGTIDKPMFIDNPFWAIDTTFYCLQKNRTELMWFYYLISNVELRKYSEASGVPSLSRETLYSIKVIAPSVLEEQQKIARVLSAADQNIATLQRKLDCLKQEKKALMQQLLTGKRRVQVGSSEGIAHDR